MKNLAKYSVEKAITVFMAVIIVAVFGVVSFTRLTTDLFPSMNIPYAVVVTTYIGASPTEVEDVVSKPLEETFATTTNIKNLTSTSQENVSIIFLEFESSANMDSVMIEMRENLDMVLSSLPDEVGNPMIIKINPDMMPIMQFSVSKEGLTQQELTLLVEDEVLPNIERIGGVASVSVSGAYGSEISVVIDDVALALVNEDIRTALLTIDPLDEVEDIQLDKEMISNILQAQNFEFPVGYINVENVNYLVRVGDEFNNLDEINDLVIFDFSPLIDVVTLSDIASVEFINANDKEYSKVNGDNAISITVQKSSNYATTDVTKEILSVIEGITEVEGIDFTILLDQGKYIEQATGSVVNNLIYGAILAVVILFIFLRNFRATFIVGIAIPISLLFAIILIYISGITLNIVSLGGLALGIGMLVDNSIVVMENIFRLKKEGLSNKEAAIKGTAQVGGAITASTLTTISVFIPIMFIEGFIKEIFLQMALTITFSLVASLLIALTFVPSISSKIFKEGQDEGKEGKAFEKFKNWYDKVFNFSFNFKFIILPLVAILFVGSIWLASTNGFEYFPTADEGGITISVSNPKTDPLSFDEFIDVLDDLNDDLLAHSDIETVGITLGGGEMIFLGISDSDNATINVILSSDRELETIDVQAELTELLDDDYSNIEYSISGSQDMTQAFTGSGIQIQLSGFELETLKDEAIAIATLLESVEGLKEIDTGVGKEADEIKITVDKAEAIKFGITTAQVMGAVAGNLSGEEVVTMLSMNGELYDVYVYDQFSKSDDTVYTVTNIENMIVGLHMMTGLPVTVNDVADVEIVKGFSTISRENGSRVLTISADFVEGFNASLVAQDVADVMEDYTAPTGYEYTVQGENEEIMEAFGVLGLAVLLAVVLIYMIMASQFQSLSYPFIIMFTIPLAFTGGFAILFITGMAVSVVSLIGLIILTGVVVNNGIVLVDYTNQLRATGLTVKEALLEAGRTRMRPIIMTALTTILALIAMALAIGEGAEMMQPMAVTTIGGLIYATMLTLIVVPIMYYLVTKYAKIFMSILSIFVLILGGGILYFFLGSILYLIGSGLLIIGVIVYLVLVIKQGVESIE
ncbi:MAG: Swarming motility protein SwrC [Candidatus Izimaplasma bacterium HR2]|nr:MAG: Swarming motility protein SwrC [Candidatus Izimaplasma bacterium HR2]